ncbi:hypothetical protein EYC80_009257 [Monilinia laxa]|uniref:Zn(2)-C6 fungal-type domain-containing protein n=1 Tax=Monilinia laxa TaxID=61186 RepID=A0A5N6JX85_MONLA|nr:hypothetical protein EYC80_009257 [Monilinia laxa]
MVGVATSKRCDNCRKRKKKCGEQRPSCAECIRSGWGCPGHLRFQSETLCASLLLQICELAVNVDKGKWSDLARGTAQLIQARGVHRYTDGFDLGMLESQLSYIVVQSAKSREDCFLHQPEWRVLLTTTSSWPSNAITPTELKSLKLRVELCSQLFQLPSILEEASSYDNRPSGSTSALDPILTNKTHRMYSNMKIWLHHAVEPHLISTPSNTTHDTIKYPDTIAGVVDCVANTTLLTLDKLLCLLYHGNISTHPINTLASPATVENWYRRASTAFEFVQTESTFAAKPLGIGISQFQSSIPKPLAMMNA